ncbi:MAG: hypothetical protein M3389_02515 [Actinomycetota bacterium]|nr:hypothetical protein [Actinomycetota bacterium]
MGRRSRKRRDPAAPMSREDRSAAMRRGYARGEERNEQIRQGLEPLAPGERPGAVTVAAIVALVLLVANVGLWLAGVEVSGREPSAGSVVLQGVVLAVAAVGMWQAKYWAVLGFQALLGLSIILAALALMVASGVGEAVFCLAIIGLGGVLFWKLVRALARLQMPERRPQRSDI